MNYFQYQEIHGSTFRKFTSRLWGAITVLNPGLGGHIGPYQSVLSSRGSQPNKLDLLSSFPGTLHQQWFDPCSLICSSETLGPYLNNYNKK